MINWTRQDNTASQPDSVANPHSCSSSAIAGIGGRVLSFPANFLGTNVEHSNYIIITIIIGTSRLYGRGGGIHFYTLHQRDSISCVWWVWLAGWLAAGWYDAAGGAEVDLLLRAACWPGPCVCVNIIIKHYCNYWPPPQPQPHLLHCGPMSLKLIVIIIILFRGAIVKILVELHVHWSSCT